MRGYMEIVLSAHRNGHSVRNKEVRIDEME